MAKRKPNEVVQVGLRMPEALRDKVERAAKKSDVSLNSELVRRIELSFEQPEMTTVIETAVASALAKREKSDG